MLILFVVYFLLIEFVQLKSDPTTYLKSMTLNMTQLYPLISILISVADSFRQDETHDREYGVFITILETASILMLWIQCFIYLRIWDSTNFLARLIIEVIY